VLVVAAALGVLLVAGRTPALTVPAATVTGPPLPPSAKVVSGAPPLGVHAYAVWSDADGRFETAARAFATALGGCRMRLGSFHACVTAPVGAMAYEARNAAGVAALYGSQRGPCGRALHIYSSALDRYMRSADAFASLPHGNPMSALVELQARYLGEQQRYLLTVDEMRNLCRPS
jgi:hypothetical protein